MKIKIILLLIVSNLLFVSHSQATEIESTILCKNKMRSIYGMDEFRQVSAEKVGHHKYVVHGKVKYHHNRYPFNCRIKRGYVTSFHYNGPTESSENYDDDHHHSSHRGKNIAIGVGIAAIAAAVIANKNKTNQSMNTNNYSQNAYNNAYDSHINNEDLEDSCHDSVDGRIKRNYKTIRRVNFTHDTIKHNKTQVVGDGRVSYYNGEHTGFSFTCQFNRNGHVIDTSYSIY